jgi:alanyl aminopeptidase
MRCADRSRPSSRCPLLLGAALIFLAPAATKGFAAAPTPDPGDPLRLGRDVAPTFQSVRLVLDADRPDYTGSVSIELAVRKPIHSFRFHAEEMKLTKVEIRKAGGRRHATARSIPIEHETGPLGLVTVSARDPLAAGSYTLDIDFANEFGTRAVGLYRMEHEGRGYLFTQFEAEDAREAFPCWDEPGFKIPYQMTLVVPEEHLAVTNSPIERESAADGLRTVVFRKTRPLPSYLLAIAAGPLEAVEMPGLSVPGRVITVRGQSALAGAAVKMTPPLLAALEAWFDSKYPFEKLDFIAVPEYWFGAMENPGAVTYASHILLLDPDSASAQERRELAVTIAHELAHMWFGDQVTMSWWDDLWLNESFAAWMGDKITEQIHPELGQALAAIDTLQATIASDARSSSQAIRRDILASGHKFENLGTAYNKGKAILGMFERWVGPEPFRRGIRDYLRAHAWGNASAADLWKALSKASGSDVSAAMAAFIDQSGLPLVSVELLPDGRLRLAQQRFAGLGVELEPRLWKIPVALRYAGGAGAGTRHVLLAGSEQIVKLEGARPEWILPDAGALGYYRWSVPPDMLRILSERSGALMSERERVAFLGNAGGLLDAGRLRGDEYLRLLARFTDDRSPQVVEAALSGLGRVKQAFVPDDLAEPFARYVRRTLAPALERIGRAPAAGEPEVISLLRPQLIEWLGEEGRDEAILAHAEELARSYRKEPASVDPALAEVALKLAALRGDRALFEEYRGRFEKTASPAERARYLPALGSFADPKLIDEALRYAIEGPLRPNEIFQVASSVGRTSALRGRRFEWAIRNYSAIASRVPPEFASLMPYFAAGCEAGRVESAREFFSTPAHQAPGTDTALAKVADQVAECLRLREREGAAVEAFLRESSSTK